MTKLKAKDIEIKFYKETAKMYEEEATSLREIISSDVMNAELDQIKKR